jgi:Zn-dependent protease
MIKSSYELTRVIGIPVRLHITLLILIILVALSTGLGGVLVAAGVFASIALHELGHSWVAIRKGCRVHEIMLLPIGGIAKMEQMPSHPSDELQIAIAGPAVSLILAALLSLSPAPIAVILSSINLMLGTFNLLPAFPMDGGRVFRAFMTPRIGRLKATMLAVRIGRILAVAGGVYGLFNGNLFLVFIAIYIYQAAGTELRSVYFGQNMQQPWARSYEQDIDVEVGPNSEPERFEKANKRVAKPNLQIARAQKSPAQSERGFFSETGP